MGQLISGMSPAITGFIWMARGQFVRCWNKNSPEYQIRGHQLGNFLTFRVILGGGVMLIGLCLNIGLRV